MSASVSDDNATVVLARHGRTTLNAQGLLRGRLDPPLDEQGLAEVTGLGRTIAATFANRLPRVIVSSPLQRAVQTAEAIAASTGARVVPDDRLADRDYGEWAGHDPAELVRRFGSVDAAPGVEPAAEVRRRAREVLDEQRSHDADTVVLVAHDAVNRLLLTDLDPHLGPIDDLSQATACWNVLTWSGFRWQVDLVDQPWREV